MKIPFPSGSNPIKRSLRRPPETPLGVGEGALRGAGIYLVPTHQHNNKVNMFILFAPKLVSGKDTKSGESGRAQDLLVH